jgi:hypothetical protein
VSITLKLLTIFGGAPGFELTFFKPTKNKHDFKLTDNGAKASEGDALEKLIRQEIEK